MPDEIYYEHTAECYTERGWFITCPMCLKDVVYTYIEMHTCSEVREEVRVDRDLLDEYNDSLLTDSNGAHTSRHVDYHTRPDNATDAEVKEDAYQDMCNEYENYEEFPEGTDQSIADALDSLYANIYYGYISRRACHNWYGYWATIDILAQKLIAAKQVDANKWTVDEAFKELYDIIISLQYGNNTNSPQVSDEQLDAHFTAIQEYQPSDVTYVLHTNC